MSFIKLLALSYLAWAAVFVVAVVLVAHLPLPETAVGGSGARVARTGAAALPPAGKPDARQVARLELAPAPVPVARPLADVPPPAPRVVPDVVKEPEYKPASTEPRQSVITAPPLAPTPANKEHASAKPDFHIPDPPPESLANLPVELQPAASRKKKQTFHIPDPPPPEPGRL